MKEFIYRVKNGLNFERSYDNEPLFFKIFLYFTYVFVIVGKAIFCVACFFTVPIWILPYMIYYCKANKSGGEDE